MANAEPTIEFYKGKASAAVTALTNVEVAARAVAAGIDISYWTLAGGHPQAGNWMHKVATPGAGSVPGETNLWPSPLPAALAPPVDSGVGFINGNMLIRDIIQGEMSSFVNILIFNNRVGAANVSAAENCFLRVYDSPTVATQTKEPMIGLGGGKHTFWTQIEQRGYWLSNGAGVWTLEAPGMTVAHRGPFHLGGTTENQWSPVLPTPDNTVVPFDDVDAKDGLGYFACGSGDGVTDRHYIGCGNGQDPLTDNLGAAVDLSMRLFVPETATAKALYWALALEYTFVVE